ncbi:BON domain-containing protein [Vibrio sp.]|uniref:BON domain-containing protein n=1 Tax=Vibrio sp. TaxID=678 RepID=UPI003D152A87
MIRIKALFTLLLLLTTSGCAGLFVAGAATTASIAIDPRSTGEILRDNQIEFEIAGMVNKAPYTSALRINAVSYRGTVVLVGQASDPQLLNEFVATTRKISGVTKVHNQVRNKGPLSVSQISNDSWITTKVKSSLLTESDLNGIKIKVITEDREVFLFGYVTKQHADLAAEIARNTIGVKQVIKAFQYPEVQ